jgi:hypothetical protein
VGRQRHPGSRSRHDHHAPLRQRLAPAELEARVHRERLPDAPDRVRPEGSCVEKETRWCRNDPSVRCATRTDCPPCPGGGACARLCAPRRLKFYFAPQGGAKAGELADLFLDPDEDGLHNAEIGSTKLLNQMSDLNGAYGDAIRRANCCVDQ